MIERVRNRESEKEGEMVFFFFLSRAREASSRGGTPSNHLTGKKGLVPGLSFAMALL